MAASALYACTKCTQRYPFEELSQGQQLCKVGGHRAHGAPIRSGSRASGGRDRGDCVPPAQMLGPTPPRSAVSGGAEPGGHQSTASQRPDADSHLTPALSGAALSFHWETGRGVCTFLLGKEPEPEAAELMASCFLSRKVKRLVWEQGALIWSSSHPIKAGMLSVSHRTK